MSTEIFISIKKNNMIDTSDKIKRMYFYMFTLFEKNTCLKIIDL